MFRDVICSVSRSALCRGLPLCRGLLCVGLLCVGLLCSVLVCSVSWPALCRGLLCSAWVCSVSWSAGGGGGRVVTVKVPAKGEMEMVFKTKTPLFWTSGKRGLVRTLFNLHFNLSFNSSFN